VHIVGFYYKNYHTGILEIMVIILENTIIITLKKVYYECSFKEKDLLEMD